MNKKPITVRDANTGECLAFEPDKNRFYWTPYGNHPDSFVFDTMNLLEITISSYQEFFQGVTLDLQMQIEVV